MHVGHGHAFTYDRLTNFGAFIDWWTRISCVMCNNDVIIRRPERTTWYASIQLRSGWSAKHAGTATAKAKHLSPARRHDFAKL